MNILYHIFELFPDKKLEFNLKSDIFAEILHKCLFNVPSMINEKNESLSKCKSFKSKTCAFNLLKLLTTECEENLDKLLEFLGGIHENSDWRKNKEFDWALNSTSNEKSLTGYVGIKNLGCSKFILLFLLYFSKFVT